MIEDWWTNSFYFRFLVPQNPGNVFINEKNMVNKRKA